MEIHNKGDLKKQKAQQDKEIELLLNKVKRLEK